VRHIFEEPVWGVAKQSNFYELARTTAEGTTKVTRLSALSPPPPHTSRAARACRVMHELTASSEPPKRPHRHAYCPSAHAFVSLPTIEEPSP
jgi:hypothetical protein